jgi:hypothetical protein
MGQTTPFIRTGRQTRWRPTTTSRCPCTDHHLASPLHRSPPRAALAQEFEEDCEGGRHIVPAGGEGGESSWHLEAGKGGECSWPLLPTRQIKVKSKSSFLLLLQIKVKSKLVFNPSTSKLRKSARCQEKRTVRNEINKHPTVIRQGRNEIQSAR